MKNSKAIIVVGGSGFIGSHLIRYLVDNCLSEKVYSIDVKEPRERINEVEYYLHDVRKPLTHSFSNVELIFNLAAIHTTPGYSDFEYFETNILGAENVCQFARLHNVPAIVFTSSISPYGPSEDIKKEITLPQPKSAYGISKLTAEYIHKCWLAESNNRKLVIVRPGVVFGKGEGGNFTRLYKSMKKRYFFYPGRKDTKKACIYVKDLVRLLYEMGKNTESFQLYNMTYPQPPTIETIVQAVASVIGTSNSYPVIPGYLLKGMAGLVFCCLTAIGKKSEICPERVEKLMLSTNVSGEKLRESQYNLKFSLQEALADWYKDCNNQGLL